MAEALLTAPAVSIVLPTRNRGELLPSALASCLRQSLRDLEVIAVDDGSEDDTPAVLAAAAARDPRVRSLRHDGARGLPAALNTGFAVARGQYLTWTSDDNAYRPQALETLWRWLEHHPHVPFVYSDYTVVDEFGEPLEAVRAPSPRDLARFPRLIPCFLYHRSVAEGVGSYSANHRLAEDWEYWRRVAERFPLGHLARDLYQYRVHPGGLTSREQDGVIDARRRALTALNAPAARY